MRNTNRLGCLSGIGILAAIITALVIVGYVYASGGLLYNPGPLNAKSGATLGGVTSHAQLGGNCRACHVAPWENARMADRCADCHGETAIQMQDVASLHGKMLHDNPGLSCRHCHPEHRDAEAPLTVMEGGEFPHEAVGYSLRGHQFTAANESFTCNDCHYGDISTFASDSCHACHGPMDPVFSLAHSIEYGDACLACHDGVDRFGQDFRHELAFRLTGKHSALLCSKCHTGARVLADFSKVSTDCNSCHRQDEPHEGRFGIDCAACHTVEGWTPASFDHDLSAFKLEGEHARAKCDQCHVNNSYKNAPKDCYSCHKEDDEHVGKFGTDCAACHQPTSWDDVTFNHNQSNFPLAGRHAVLACEQCHTNNQFAGLSTACVSCHTDPVFHAGMFGTDCASCHTADNWFAVYKGSHPGIADEGGRGVNHGGASCRDCHTQTLYAATCTKCHEGNNPEGEGGGD